MKLLAVIMQIILSLLLILIFGNVSSPVHAKNLQSTFNSLVESLEQLTAIKNGSDNLTENRDDIEIEARKTAFNRVLDLALEEVRGLKKKLEKISNQQGNDYLRVLSEYQAYYELLRGQINREISINELVDLAQKLKKWRKVIYNEKIERIFSFVWVHQNQEMIRVGENRLKKISRDFTLIKSLLKPTRWNEAEKLVNNADAFIKEAREINQETQKMLTEDNVGLIEPLVQKATQKITEAYYNFIALSDLVREQ